ncbi:centromere protein T isoform X1 [Alosa sapidissima]|uniref:centromere protein T isoform X1 n=1 Tax=Alosa sapidissima TaxID=34773 RepID=UPI001C08CDE3|nr:centromere protein T isoform X1 [Alosa sapidissima]
MDSLEDVSARLILRNVLQTEKAKSPVKERVTRLQSQPATQRRMSRIKTGRKTSGARSPLVALQQKLKQRVREGASCSPPPTSKQNKESTKKPPQPLLEYQLATPRVLLRRIIQTQAEAPMVSNQPDAKDVNPIMSHTPCTEEVRPLSSESNLYYDCQRDPEVQSELDLSNITLELMQPIPKGLSRKRAPTSISVSAFERQLEHLTEAVAEPDVLEDFSSNSSPSLTLNTPSLHVTAQRGHLQRKPVSRELVTEEVFDKAVHIRLQECPEPSGILASKMERDSSWQGFTLGMSDVTVPDLTTDIIMNKTALYTQSLSRPATVDCVEELQTNPSEKEELEYMKQTTITEVGCTYPNEMVPETQEEEEFVSGTTSEITHMDDPDHVRVEPMSECKVQDSGQEAEKQQLDKSTANSSGVIPESLSLVVEELQAKIVECYDGTTLTPAIESEEIENGSEVVQMARGLPDDKEMDTLQYPEQVVHNSVYFSEHGATSEVSTKTRKSGCMFNVGAEKDYVQLKCKTGRQSDHVLDPDSALPSMLSERTNEELEEENDCQELAQQTPVFVRQRKEEPTIALSPPVVNSGNPRPVAGKSQPHQKRRPAVDRILRRAILPKTYVLTMFRHFAKTKVSSDVYPVVNDILQRYFGRVAEDLEAFASHAKRKTIEKDDVELLMRRQGFMIDCSQVNVLIEKFLPLEYRKLLVPIATSGNKVIPKERY